MPYGAIANETGRHYLVANRNSHRPLYHHQVGTRHRSTTSVLRTPL